MNIGIVTTWYERGAAYVSRIYKDLIEADPDNQVYIYSRAGEIPPKDSEKWNEDYVTRDNTWRNMRVSAHKFFSWIKRNSLDVIIFNEQQDFRIVAQTKKKFPNIKLAAYIDYYTERTRKWYQMYDFVICNTKRHVEAMEGHPQIYYMRWGTDTELYHPVQSERKELTFFHSVGSSVRKGTDILIDAFIDGELYKKSKLIIHTQIPIKKVTNRPEESLINYNIEIIEKTVTAPGLYHLGDVYVYPTRLDGLGLTMYEATSCGLPSIVTNFPPMNEAIKEEFGRLVAVKDYYCRQDAYYYPMSICDKDDLIRCMRWYVDNPENLAEQKKAAREYALANYNISDRAGELNNILKNARVRKFDTKLYSEIMCYYKHEINTIHIYFDTKNIFCKPKYWLLKKIRRG